jgi:hypothetical protein
MGNILEVTDANFEAEIVNGDTPSWLTSGQNGAARVKRLGRC